MEYEELYLSTTPLEEPCLQVGKATYEQMRHEACYYRDGLVIDYIDPSGIDPSELKIIIRRESHDFGDYPSVVLKFNANNPEAAEIAYDLEANEPNEWADLGLDKPTPQLNHLRGG